VAEDIGEEVTGGARRGEARIFGDWRTAWRWWFLRAEGATRCDRGAVALKRRGSTGWLWREATVEDGEDDRDPQLCKPYASDIYSTPAELGHGMHRWHGNGAGAEEMTGWWLELRREWLSARALADLRP
jgi:hypothetical protein